MLLIHALRQRFPTVDIMLGVGNLTELTEADTSGINALLFGLCAVATLAWMAWFLARGERERDPLLRAWHRLDARYARLGLGREPHETAGDWARRVATRRPQGANLLFSLSRRFADARYAPNEGDHRALIEDLRRHRP